MSLEYPIPRLPQPLTEEGLRSLMRERAYWDLQHPRSSLYQRLVAQGFAMLFPGKTKYDETGKAIDVSPLPPEAVAHQVAQVNREMDRLERDLRGSGGGAVHVQSHTRDGGKTEVIDYWRAKPGQGNGDDARGGDRTEPTTNRDAGDTEDIQAGTDDDRPKYDDPFSRLPQIEIRNDRAGGGYFGAGREDPYGNQYEHRGVDILAPPGATMTSPADGVVEVRDSYKDGRFDNRYKNIWIKTNDGTEIGLFYVTPHDSNGNVVVKTGDRIKTGKPIGTVQDRAAADRSGKMKNHVHVEIRDKSKRIIDPTPTIEEWQKRR